MKRSLRWLVLGFVVLGIAGLSVGPAAGSADKAKIGKAEDYDPTIDPADFAGFPIDNQYLPMVPGTTFFYEMKTGDGLETDEVYITHQTKPILGVTCVVVLDTVKLEGVLIELTYDWYAQDKDGNVWYFGEDSTQYEGGVPVGTAGSWEAGVDGARPGIVMLADPRPGESYRQEYQAGVAEDMASVLRLNAVVEVPYGSFPDCLETKEWSPLETGAVEQKFYAPGVGNVLVVEHHGKAVRQELVNVTTD